MEFNFKQLQEGNQKKKKKLKKNSGFEGIPTCAYQILVGRNLVYMLQAWSGNSRWLSLSHPIRIWTRVPPSSTSRWFKHAQWVRCPEFEKWNYRDHFLSLRRKRHSLILRRSRLIAATHSIPFPDGDRLRIRLAASEHYFIDFTKLTLKNLIITVYLWAFTRHTEISFIPCLH